MADLQVKNNGLLTTENGGGVRKQGIKDSEITRMNLNPMHDRIFVRVQQWALPCSIEHNPTSRRLCLLLHNRLRIRRDDAPIPRHPLPVPTLNSNHMPRYQTRFKIQFNFKLDSIQQNPPLTPQSNFLTPLLHIWSTHANWASLRSQNFFSNTTMRNQIPTRNKHKIPKKETFPFFSFLQRDETDKTMFVSKFVLICVRLWCCVIYTGKRDNAWNAGWRNNWNEVKGELKHL